jgi:hypothetical protein
MGSVEGFLAARIEARDGGFVCWAALIRVDDTLQWADAGCLGRAPQVTVATAQCAGTIAVLKKMRALREQSPDVRLAMFTDSRQLVEELKGDWKQAQRGSSAVLDEATDLVRALAPLQLRYCSRHANLVAHEVLTGFLKRRGITVRAMVVRR